MSERYNLRRKSVTPSRDVGYGLGRLGLETQRFLRLGQYFFTRPEVECTWFCLTHTHTHTQMRARARAHTHRCRFRPTHFFLSVYFMICCRWEWRPGIQQVHASTQVLRPHTHQCQTRHLRHTTQRKYHWWIKISISVTTITVLDKVYQV